jgi:ATP-binding protein involved in chromosome partitioning
MSTFICPTCSSSHPIFGSPAHIAKMCEDQNLRLLGEIPLHASICEDADRGMPTVVAEPYSMRAKAFERIAATAGELVGL